MMRRDDLAEGISLYLADCRDVLPTLAPKSIGLALFDPPYEGHMHEAKRGKKIFGAQRRIRRDGHANPPPVDFSAIEPEMRAFAAKECQRLLRGWSLIFCTPEGIAPWRDALEAAGAKYKRACFWNKPDSAPQFNGQGPAMAVECFTSAWHGEGHSRWNGGGRRNYFFTHLCQPSDRTGEHPTEKPTSLMLELVELWSNAGDTVLDPFMGSGSTGVACAMRGRNFVGVETSEKYFDLARRRIDEALRQFDFFVEKAAPAKQEAML